MNNIPNRIKQPANCCIYCGKTYKLRSNLQKHTLLCEILHQPKRKKIIIEDEADEIPSQKKLYHILLELCCKYNNLEQKVDEMNKYVIKKKKQINVLEWLNNNITPSILFEKLHEQIYIVDEDIDSILTNSFYDTLNAIFSRTIYNVTVNQYPIFAFVQKVNTFYIYDRSDKDKIEWHELTREKLIKFLNKIHLKLSKCFHDWKVLELKKNKSDKFAIICDKTLIKLMEINFRHDYTLTKTKSLLYSKMKTDIKALVEYEFEF
jgi:hypothetical protein